MVACTLCGCQRKTSHRMRTARYYTRVVSLRLCPRLGHAECGAIDGCVRPYMVANLKLMLGCLLSFTSSPHSPRYPRVIRKVPWADVH
eukprot:scaffold2156_cov32-Tisochrysis_lutea.AAC.1